jgi:hypothetical protein
MLLGDVLHLQALECEAFLLKSLDNLSYQASLNAIRLDHDVGLLHVSHNADNCGTVLRSLATHTKGPVSHGRDVSFVHQLAMRYAVNGDHKLAPWRRGMCAVKVYMHAWAQNSEIKPSARIRCTYFLSAQRLAKQHQWPQENCDHLTLPWVVGPKKEEDLKTWRTNKSRL